MSRMAEHRESVPYGPCDRCGLIGPDVIRVTYPLAQPQDTWYGKTWLHHGDIEGCFSTQRVEIARLRADLTTKDEELRVLLSGTVEGELRLQLASARQEIERQQRQRDAAKRVVEAAQAVKARSRCTSGSIFVEPPTEVGATAFWLAIRDVHAALAAWREGRT